MSRSRSQYRAPVSSQRGAFVKGHDSEPDVTLSNVTLGKETEKAVLVTVKDSPEPIWMPLSQVTKMVRVGEGKDTIIISAWIAKQKGLS